MEENGESSALKNMSSLHPDTWGDVQSYTEPGKLKMDGQFPGPVSGALPDFCWDERDEHAQADRYAFIQGSSSCDAPTDV